MTQTDTHHQGPPWVGPVMPRWLYERHWLWIYLTMSAAAIVFFGWRALLGICLTTALGVGVFMSVAVVLRIVWKKRTDGSLTFALNMSLLMGLTMPIMSHMWLTALAGVLIGIASHLMGAAYRVRVHPVAVVQVALMQVALLLSLPLAGHHDTGSVLAPNRIIFGDVTRANTPIGGATWWWMSPEESFDAITRNDPQRLIHKEQRDILHNSSRLITLLESGQLPRMIDVLIGATGGPVGATSQLLLILGGMWLIYRRVGRWPTAMLAVVAAIVTLTLLPLNHFGDWMFSAARFPEIGWRVSITYMGYQLLASPLLLIVLIMAPMTMPRTGWGRTVYALIIGVGIVAIRWWIPYDGIEYVPLIVAGLGCPLLDRLRVSPFVQQSV